MMVAMLGAAMAAGADEAEARARALVAQMTLEEKVAQSSMTAPAIPRLGVPAYDWWNEALHGVARSGLSTVFPQTIGRAAAFDAPLERAVGRAIGIEARAKYNILSKKGVRGRYDGLTLWSPNVNLFRDPRWGRGQETFGEDPFLTGELAVAFVRGVQGEGRHLLAAACAKHWCVHSGPEEGRRAFDARVSDEDLRDFYLQAFERLVKEAKVEAVMSAYNAVNGEPVSASAKYLGGLLRGTWGFDGHIVSDVGAVEAVYENQRFVPDSTNAVALCWKAGLDLCSSWCGDALLPAVREGKLDEKTLDAAVTRLMRARYRLGILGGEKTEWDGLGEKDVHCAAHVALAERSAAESLVLLKNNGVLPFDRAKLGTLGVVGPMVHEVAALIGNYNGYASAYSTLSAGIVEQAGAGVHVYCDRICPVTGGADRYDLAFAFGTCEAVVVGIGYTADLEGEEGDVAGAGNGDRVKYGLPGNQLAIVKAAKQLGVPVVSVVFGGSPVDLSEVAALSDAVLLAWYPGERGGAAIGKALFGDYNPAGRLPVTFPRSYDDLPPFADYSLAGRTYRYATKAPLYPFGYGLSYTTFAYADAEAADGSASVSVTNTGRRDGDEVVQVYARTPGARERHRLVGFCREHLKAGERRTVRVVLRDARKGDTLFIGGGQPGFAETVSTVVR